ncbi:MAG: hypothetical protein H0W89_04160 [Candidatus Levybacteria bacterium]|nr:hypothetical protein [Candidatus Levybacteria bacterium]
MYKKAVIIILITLLISHLSSLISQKVHAEGISVKMSPSLIQIKTQAPNSIQAPIIVENLSNQSVTFKIRYRLINPAASQNGKVVFMDDANATADIFQYIDIIDIQNNAIDTLDLGPKQQKQLQVRVNLPPNHPSADYYFSLILAHDVTQQSDQNSTISNKKDQRTIATIQGGIATNVLLAIGAPETAQGYIEEFSTPLYRQDGPVPFTLQVKNTGLHYISPKGLILIKNIFGQTIGRVEIPASAILAGTTRSLLDKKQLTEAINQQDKSAVIWPERFLFGFYSADLSISMAEEGPFYNQTIRFMAFPIYIILGFFFTIALCAVIYKRVKKKIA